jgi:hypothetical protein
MTSVLVSLLLTLRTSGRTPARVCLRHRANQRTDVGRHGWSPYAVPALPSPHSRKPRRCQAMTVSGLTMTSAVRHPDAGESHPEPTADFVSRNRLGRVGWSSCSLVPQGRHFEPERGARSRPRINGELLKLGIDVCQATVAKYMGAVPADILHLPARLLVSFEGGMSQTASRRSDRNIDDRK